MAPGARGASKGHRSDRSEYKNQHRNGIHKKSPAPRTERDGDLIMDGAEEIAGRSAQGARRGKYTPRGAPRNSNINPHNLAKAIARTQDNTKTINMRDAPRGPRRTTPPQNQFEKYDQIVVRGWTRSEAVKNVDQGIPQLISFINWKASKDKNLKLIQEHQVRGDNLFIYTPAEDREKILRLNNFQFARATLSFELKREAKVSVQDVKSVLKSMVLRRYNETEKTLDLSGLEADPDLMRLEMFKTQERASKVNQVIVSICEGIWPNQFKRSQAIQTLRFANNNLSTVSQVSVFSQTFPKIRNLDLSNNNLDDLKALEPWSRKFRQLDHLILKDNKIETVPDFHLEIMKWFPKLRTLDTVQLRADDQVAQTMNKIPVAAPIQEGDIDIAESFLTQFFPTFDENRSAAVATFYADTSVFSVNVKSRSSGNYDKKSWDKWLGLSRNLKKITSSHGQNQRCFTGPQDIAKCFSDMPITKHPNFIQEKEKWLMECKMIEGLPDPTGQAPYGVNGLVVDIHGEFQEIGPDNQVVATRSFDRKFVLGPGGEPGSIKIIQEMLTLRPYTGSERFKSTVSPQVQPQSDINTSIPELTLNNGIDIPAGLAVPAGFALPAPEKSPEQLQQELLTLELSKATRMTLEYAFQCLQETQWNLENVGIAFETNKDKLPPNAFW